MVGVMYKVGMIPKKGVITRPAEAENKLVKIDLRVIEVVVRVVIDTLQN